MYRKETTLWSPFLKGAEHCRGGSLGAKGHSRESMTVEPPSLSGSLSGNSSVLVAAVLAVLVVVWAATNLVLGGEGFAVLVSDKVVGGEEAASALARLFAALVLGLFLADAVGWRARWIAGGLVVLGLGHFVFGYWSRLYKRIPPNSTSRSTRPSSPRRWRARSSW